MLSLYEISNKFERLNDCPVIDAISIYITQTEDPYSISYMLDYYTNIIKSRSKYLILSNKLRSAINVDTPMKALIKNKKMLCGEVAEYIKIFHNNLEDMLKDVYEVHINELDDMGLENNDKYKIDGKSSNYIMKKEFGKLDDLNLTAYIIERVKPWIRTDYDRVGKHSKIFMTDSGLMSSLLGWGMDQVRFDSDRCGKLVETLVFHNLSALIDASFGKYSLYHYRDREKREIDFLVEREDGSMVGIEVKSSSSVGKNDFKNLAWFRKNMARENSFTGLVMYTGEESLPFGDGLWAVPISDLWK